MLHYGDITKLSGYELPVVDVITGGSPCQDLSVAGKRAGLAGERSGLFMEQMRIVREMREKDARDNGRTGVLVRPRYMVWENVPGAFSSKEGADFAAVIEEIIKVCEPGADVCVCVPDGGWTKSGHYYAANGAWSIAWRLHDAQFWGVPQRRKRIALVADFNGLSASTILFDPQLHGETVYSGFFAAIRDFAERCGRKIQSFCKSLSGDSEPCGAAGKGTAAGAESGVDSTICLQGNGIDRADTAGCNGAGWRRGAVTPLTRSTDPPCAVSKNEPVNLGGAKESSYNMNTPEPCQPSTIKASLMCGNPWDSQSERVYHGDGAWHSLNANETGGQSRDAVMCAAFKAGNGAKAGNIGYEEELSPTLSAAESGTNQVPTCFAVDCRNATENSDVNGTLQAKSGGGTSLNCNNVIRTNHSP